MAEGPGGSGTVHRTCELVLGGRFLLPRRLGNAVTRRLFTDINRRFGEILRAAGAPLRIEHDEPAFLGNTFRILLLRKEAAS